MYEPIQQFRKSIKSGRKLFCSAVTFSDPIVTDCLADSLDFIWIDLEHSKMSHDALISHLMAARGAGLGLAGPGSIG